MNEKRIEGMIKNDWALVLAFGFKTMEDSILSSAKDGWM